MIRQSWSVLSILTGLVLSPLVLSPLDTGAYAQASQVNETQAPKTGWAYFKEKFRLTYYGQYVGFSLARWDGQLSDNNGGQGGAAELYNQITTGWRIGDKGWSINFLSRIGLAQVQTASANGQFHWYAPRISVQNPSLFKIGGVNFTSNFFAELPLTNDATDTFAVLTTKATSYAAGAPYLNGLILAPAFFSVISYDVPESRFTLGGYLLVKQYIYSDPNAINIDPTAVVAGVPVNKRLMEWYIAPWMYYKLTKRVSLMLMYEILTRRKYGDPAFSMPSNGTDVQVGVNWDVSENFSINPYIQFLVTPPAGVNAYGFVNTATIGAYLSGSVF